MNIFRKSRRWKSSLVKKFRPRKEVTYRGQGMTRQEFDALHAQENLAFHAAHAKQIRKDWADAAPDAVILLTHEVIEFLKVPMFAHKINKQMLGCVMVCARDNDIPIYVTSNIFVTALTTFEDIEVKMLKPIVITEHSELYLAEKNSSNNYDTYQLTGKRHYLPNPKDFFGDDLVYHSFTEGR